MGVLHGIEASNVLGHLGDLDGEIKIVRREFPSHLIEYIFVFPHQGPLTTSMRRLVEEIER